MVFYVIAASLLAASTNLMATGSEGHGTDGIKILFEEARIDGLRALDKPNFLARLKEVDQFNIYEWFFERKEKFFRDLKNTPFEWRKDDAERSDCAMTTLKQESAPIRFAQSTCRKSITTVERARTTLFHEVAHHLGVEDEDFASQIGVTLSQAYDSPMSANQGFERSLSTTEMPCELNRALHLTALDEDHVMAMATSAANVAGHELKPLCSGIFDFAANRWTKVEDFMLPPGVSYYRVWGSLTKDKKMHALVEENNTDRVSGSLTILTFDLATKQWTRLPFAIDGGLLHVIGTDNGKFRVWVMRGEFRDRSGESYRLDALSGNIETLFVNENLNEFMAFTMNPQCQDNICFSSLLKTWMNIDTGEAEPITIDGSWSEELKADILYANAHWWEDKIYIFINNFDGGFWVYNKLIKTWQKKSAPPYVIPCDSDEAMGDEPIFTVVDGKFNYSGCRRKVNDSGLLFDPERNAWFKTNLLDATRDIERYGEQTTSLTLSQSVLTLSTINKSGKSYRIFGEFFPL